MIHVGDIGSEISIDFGEDISGASVRKIVALKPDGTSVTWTAVADGGNGVKYTTVAGDINQSGTWRLQAYLVIGGWSGYSDQTTMTVQARLADATA